MIVPTDNLLTPPAAKDKLDRLLSNLSPEQSRLIDLIQSEVLSHISLFAKTADFATPAIEVDRIFQKAAGDLRVEEQNLMKRALVARLGLSLPAIVGKLDLPESIVAMYPAAVQRLADFLESANERPYDSKGEFFRKDIRFVLGLTVPCGARVVDLISRVPLSTAMYSTIRSKDIRALIRYIRVGGTGLWFRNHADSRYLAEYTEEAHDNFYLRVADLLKQHPRIRGLAGTSWYYDPEVSRISPRLSYLHDRPKERGAFFLRHGTDSNVISNATMKSATRRRLHLEGKYLPVSYSMLWPRRELLEWAKRWRSPHVEHRV
jgi:hypothetical protein